MFNCTNLEIYDEIFTDLDVDKSGKLELEELKSAFVKTGSQISLEELEYYARLLGFGNTLELNREQFKKLLFAFENADAGNPAELLFFAFDEDYSGMIDMTELQEIMRKIVHGITDAVIAETMRLLVNKQGQISYQMFMEFIRELYK